MVKLQALNNKKGFVAKNDHYIIIISS